jgi:uncharacterized protein (TIGR03437 family)
MDAAYTYFNKTVLFLATALLTVVPGLAQPQFVLNGSQVTAASVTAGISTAGTITVASSLDPTTEIAFTATVAYGAGDRPWLNGWPTQGSSQSGTTPTPLYFLISSNNMPQHTATITLTATTPASGVTNATITVYFPGSSGSGGTISAGTNPVYLSAAVGASTSTTDYLTGNAGIGFTATVTTGGTWLSVALTTGYTNTQLPSSLTITASAVSITTPGVYTGSITVAPTSGGGAPTVINVQFTVGTGGTGTLTANPSYFSWSYNTATPLAYPLPQSVTLTSASGASYYTASVSPSNSWLLANGYATTTSGSFTSGSGTILIAPNDSYFSSLTGGTTGYVYVTDSNGNHVTITVYLSVNGSGSTSGITWYPNPAILPTAAVGGSTVSLTVYLNSASTGTFTASVANITGTGLTISQVFTTTTTPAAAYVIVYGNPGGLAANNYSGYLYVYLSSGPTQTIPLTFPVGTTGITSAGIVTPTSLVFSYQTGTTVTGQTLPSQGVLVSGTGQFTVGNTITYSANTPPAVNWLTVSPPSGYAPETISVSVSPTSLPAGTYTATVPVTPYTGASPITMSVTFLVTASPVLIAYPGSLNFTYQAGGGNPSSTLYLSASDGSAMTVSAATSVTWLTVSSPASTTPIPISVQGNNLSSLANGVYTGVVTLTDTAAANNPMSVPVVLTVTGSTATGGSLTLSPSSMTFSAVQSGTVPASQTLYVSASTTTSYTATAATTTTTGSWLSISPSGSLNTASNPSIAVSVNQSGLTAASSPYYGTITLMSNGIQQTVQVTLVVSTTSTGGSGNVTASPTSLSFIYTVGGTQPPAQNLQVTSASGSAPVSFTISSNASWLSAGVINGTSLNTPVTFNVSTVDTNLSSLAASSIPYSTTITITPTGGTVVTVPVTLTVQAAPTVTATPTTLSFTYQVGGTNPPTQTVSVSGGGQSLGFAATVTSGSSWLSVSPTSGTTPTTGTAALTVTAAPGTLGAGSYNGAITVSGTGAATGSTSINVTLTVTAPLPTIASVVNAASFVGGKVSPGEIVTIFGTNMGPATAAYAAIDPSTGKLSATIGGVQVLFNGIAAPMIYASATQVSTIVPYEMAQFASPTVWVKYAGQTSNALQLTSTTTAPGIFTLNSQGSGPAVVVNQNGTLNGQGNPAAKGSIIYLYVTGEGQTSPPGVTGSITAATLPPPQVTPAPLLAVGVLINGLPALPVYAGEAPTFVAGLMQLNVQIPPNVQSGNVSIQVLIGGNPSQTGVTVWVQ